MCWSRWETNARVGCFCFTNRAPIRPASKLHQDWYSGSGLAWKTKHRNLCAPPYRVHGEFSPSCTTAYILWLMKTYRLFHSTGPNKRQAHAMDYGYTKQKRFRITSVRAQTKLRFRFALHLAEAFLDGHGGRTICAVSSDVRFRNPDSNPSFV